MCIFFVAWIVKCWKLYRSIVILFGNARAVVEIFSLSFWCSFQWEMLSFNQKMPSSNSWYTPQLVTEHGKYISTQTHTHTPRKTNVDVVFLSFQMNFKSVTILCASMSLAKYYHALASTADSSNSLLFQAVAVFCKTFLAFCFLYHNFSIKIHDISRIYLDISRFNRQNDKCCQKLIYLVTNHFFFVLENKTWQC